MKPLRNFSSLLRQVWIGIILVVILAIVTAGRIYFASAARRRAAEGREAPLVQKQTGPQPAGKPPQTVSEEFGEKFSNFTLPPERARKKSEPKEPPPIPEEVKKRLINQPTPISLYPPHVTSEALPAVPPTYYLPSFRIIRCELIAGPQTGNIETPLIGIVLENQYAIDPDGISRLVIPAGVEVHGLGKPSPLRDRIDGNGKWTFVWRTAGEDNSMELSISALALNRDYDEAKRTYGDLEKSPGIVGRRFQSVGDQAIEEALLDAVASVSRSLKSYTTILNPLTSQVVNAEKPTIGNALLEGAGAGTDRLAQMVDDIRKQIDEKGYYVAVLPGTEFYLYTREPIDLRKAHRPQALAVNTKERRLEEPAAPAPVLAAPAHHSSSPSL